MAHFKQNQLINLDLLGELLEPFGYSPDFSQDYPFFWKEIKHNDVRSSYAFSLVIIRLDEYVVRIEGLNEPRLRKAIRAGLIEVQDADDVEALKETVFEGVLDERRRLETVLQFFEQQLQALAEEPIYSDEYKKALSNIQLLVEAAEQSY